MPIASMLVLTAACAAAGPLSPRVLYVDDDAAPGGDGTSWNTAMPYLSDALDLAGDGPVVIRIGGGTYVPDRSEAAPMGTASPAATFLMPAVVTLEGGYRGLAARPHESPDERDPSTVMTRLSGDLSLLPVSDSTARFALHVVRCIAGSDIVLDGLSIESGRATGTAINDRRGAGIAINGAHLTLRSCTLADCRASLQGGAVHAVNAVIVAESTVFHRNSANNGAGLWADDSIMSFADCAFVANATTGSGGGIMTNGESSITLRRCRFEDNEGGPSAASLIGHDCLVDACTFVGNTGGTSVGLFPQSMGILQRSVFRDNRGGTPLRAFGNAIVRDCEFLDNIAASSAGALYSGAEHLDVLRCRFIGNRTVSSEGGGAITVNGHIHVVDSEFRNNSAANTGDGGCLLQKSGTAILENCLIVGHRAGGTGGAFFADNSASALYVTNCTIADNRSSSTTLFHAWYNSFAMFRNCIIREDRSQPLVFAFSGVYIWARYSNVSGGWPAYGGNNMDADPEFVDVPAGDFHLAPGSPCIDAGCIWFVPEDSFDADADGVIAELYPLDLDGAPRLQDAGNACHPAFIVDLGAYEAPGAGSPSRPYGDITFDGLVDAADLALLLSTWGPCLACCGPDLDGDTFVGPDEIADLLSHWSD